MGKKVKRKTTNQFLIIKCEELSDQFECDACREPLCIVGIQEIKDFKRGSFEIYEIYDDGHLKLIKEYYKDFEKRS